jgi:C-terminal processing protease CtpA/Prc
MGLQNSIGSVQSSNLVVTSVDVKIRSIGGTYSNGSVFINGLNIGYVDLTSYIYMLNRNFIRIELRDNSLISGEVNQYLKDFDSLSNNQYSGRIIDISGNNGPLSSDGISSRNSLLTKGFIVITA